MAVRSLSVKRRADEQKLDTRLSSRVEQAQDCNDHESALHSKSGGYVVTVHALIRGDLLCVQFVTNGAWCSNASRNTAEVSSGRSSKIDLAAFFDSVNHDVLMRLVAQHVTDKRVLKLIGRYLRAGVEVDGVKQPTPLGVPQGGPLSPLLANIVLHELDGYLESQGRRFARYADDFVICVRSTSAAQRVKANVTRFLKQRLKLSINHDKSRVVSSKQLEFLGFCFRGTKIVWSDKALQRFKHRVRQLTGRSWGVSMEHRYKELRRYVVGWLNYFALSEYYRPIPELDEWLRRRLRTCYWKQWRWARTKIRHLVALGIGLKDAIKAGMSSKGPYCMSRTKVTQIAMSNTWLKQQGLVSIKDQWSRFHYPASTA